MERVIESGEEAIEKASKIVEERTALEWGGLLEVESLRAQNAYRVSFKDLETKTPYTMIINWNTGDIEQLYEKTS